jgi:hypothetical protein
MLNIFVTDRVPAIPGVPRTKSRRNSGISESDGIPCTSLSTRFPELLTSPREYSSITTVCVRVRAESNSGTEFRELSGDGIGRNSRNGFQFRNRTKFLGISGNSVQFPIDSIPEIPYRNYFIILETNRECCNSSSFFLSGCRKELTVRKPVTEVS